MPSELADLCCPPERASDASSAARAAEGLDAELAAFARALSHPVRVRILRLLATTDTRRCRHLVDELPLAQSTISEHLRILRSAGLVQVAERGDRIGYCLVPSALSRLSGLVEILRSPAAPPLGFEVRSGQERSMPTDFNMLFLCTGNSARSILAEVLAGHVKVTNGSFRGFSAGSHPKGSVHPVTLEVLREQGYDVSGLRSKSWEEFARPGAPAMDFVFTVCDHAAAEVCPVWPGQPLTAHWGVPDPAAVTGSDEQVRKAFRDTMVILKRRLELLGCLPIEKLGRLALGERLREIGRQ